MPGAYLYGWDVTNEVWVKCLVNAEGKLIIDPSEIFENTPTDNEHGKAPDSDWAHDHGADGGAHHAQLHVASHENGGGDEISVTGLSGVLSDRQDPQDHGSRHENGGSDPITNLGGNVAFPDLSYFRAYMSSNQSIVLGEFRTAQFDILNFDNRSEFDTDNYQFVVGKSGLYCLYANVFLRELSSNDLISVKITEIGGLTLGYTRNSFNNTREQILNITGIYELSSDDIIEVQVYNGDSDCQLNASQISSYFCGFRVA